MNNTILTDGTVVYYVICKNGTPISPKFESKIIAESEMVRLLSQQDQQGIIEVVAVTSDGRQVLMG